MAALTLALLWGGSSWAQSPERQDPESRRPAPLTLPDLPSIPGTTRPPGALEAETTVKEPETRALVVPREETVLSSRMAGRIAALPLRDGDRFAKGDVLVRFDCAKQEAKLRKARTELEAAKRQLAVNKELANLNSISGIEVELAEIAVLTAEAEVDTLVPDVALCEIKAPYDGRVVKVQAKAFQTVDHADPLIEILDDSVLEVEAIVPSVWLRWLKPGAPFAVVMDETGRSYKGAVDRLAARIDPASQSILVTGRFRAKPSDLLAGMTGTLRFIGAGG